MLDLKLHRKLEKGKCRILVKVGSQAVTLGEGGVDPKKISRLCEDLAWLRHSGNQVILISSGAIQTGRGSCTLDEQKISGLQALSALGQPQLMEAYRKELSRRDMKLAQVLLTHEDFKNRTRFFNAKETLEVLLKSGIIPIINENDTVSFKEITLGDNDQLSAVCAQMLKPDMALFLTGSQGLYNSDPNLPQSKLIPIVEFEDIRHARTSFMRSLKFGKATQSGTGGMESKLKAIRTIAQIGIPCFLGSYELKRPVQSLLMNNLGTFFGPNLNSNDREGKKDWIRTGLKRGAEIEIDQGAGSALLKNKSLLPIGVLRVRGQIARGDCVALICRGHLVGIGVSEYSTTEINKILGKESKEIALILGHRPSKNIVHKNNLVLV